MKTIVAALLLPLCLNAGEMLWTISREVELPMVQNINEQHHGLTFERQLLDRLMSSMDASTSRIMFIEMLCDPMELNDIAHVIMENGKEIEFNWLERSTWK